MNNNDLRREIFTFLRKKAKLNCRDCNRVLIWDRKPVCAFYSINDNSNLTIGNIKERYSTCDTCWRNDMYFLTWVDEYT